MADTDTKPMRESAIEPPPGHHEVPMPERPIETNRVRQGVTFGHMRWVLLASLVLVVLGLILARVVS
ncbi:hypothetical protein BKE38_28640 [Pseudoroseomonas deserti]|uniref:Uncharacterized protein n=1 Tax=Teichococcus deserti TaxID=1817963 RepID=A0A1V2GTN1_9PROT|nr:hypothetical protein [Pseudoroseomonas deserti]ONG43853.1 hypothetical protein BKE38_28640 [Pseudoroseomonas deserti]